MRGKYLAAMILLLVNIGMMQQVTAKEWPSQPVSIVVPYPPGGDTDILARKLAERLSQLWKQAVVVENKPGAAEIIGANSVVNSKPNGYTLLMASQIALETNLFMFSKLTYDPIRDLTPITRVIDGPFLYVVRKDSPFHSIQQLAVDAKETPQKISYGSGGVGGIVHLAVNWFAKVAGDIEFTHIPYKGGAQRLQDLLAGRIDFTLAPLGAAGGLLESDRIRVLATSGTSRLKALPEVPTLSEAGFENAAITFMFALAGPAELPQQIADKIAHDVAIVVNEPEFRSKNIDPLGYSVVGDSPAEFRQFLKADRKKQKALVEAANVQLD